jgi:hypothetical protein
MFVHNDSMCCPLDLDLAPLPLPEQYGANSLRSMTLKVHASATHSFASIDPLASRHSHSSSHYVSSTPRR